VFFVPPRTSSSSFCLCESFALHRAAVCTTLSFLHHATMRIYILPCLICLSAAAHPAFSCFHRSLSLPSVFVHPTFATAASPCLLSSSALPSPLPLLPSSFILTIVSRCLAVLSHRLVVSRRLSSPLVSLLLSLSLVPSIPLAASSHLVPSPASPTLPLTPCLSPRARVSLSHPSSCRALCAHSLIQSLSTNILPSG
jgi:hypothetical protein